MRSTPVYSPHNARSHWLFLGCCVILARESITGLQFIKLERSRFSGNLKPRPRRIDRASEKSIRQALGLRFTRFETRLWVNKYSYYKVKFSNGRQDEPSCQTSFSERGIRGYHKILESS